MDRPRECGRCGETCGAGAPDPCLGRLPGVLFACCGHGEEHGYIVFMNQRYLRFELEETEMPTAGKMR